MEPEKEMEVNWTPTPFNLLDGNPFQYSSSSISTISGTEEFDTAIDQRDNEKCVVCGDPLWVERAYIVPTTDARTWNEMRSRSFIPLQAKSVGYEARNGMVLCMNHRYAFDAYYFYIRWTPEARRFVLINHSQLAGLERWHGRAINLRAEDHRLPFHGAFLVHEARVRGWWAFRTDRPISLPIPWQQWVSEESDNSTDSSDFTPDRQSHDSFPTNPTPAGQQPKTFTPTNPFANPAELQALKHSFSKQPNWKAAVLEGETWEGTAEENVNKWQRLMGDLS